jgi:hypothetical protein
MVGWKIPPMVQEVYLLILVGTKNTALGAHALENNAVGLNNAVLAIQLY